MTMRDHLGFLESQTNYIESQAYMIMYPDIQYPRLVPVSQEAPEWVRGITYYSMDITGQADFLANRANDIPLADVRRAQHDVTVEMMGIGYDYTLEELEQARLIPGRQLTADKAVAARRAAEEAIDRLVLNGDAEHGWDGLLNNGNVISADAVRGGGNKTDWPSKDGDEIVRDINDALTGLWVNSLTVELADTLALPPAAFSHIANIPRSVHSDMSIMEWIMMHNIYTMQTGNPLNVVVLRGLEEEANGRGRLIAYRRSPDVLRLHLPMPHRFLPPQQMGLRFIVPGIFRLGGLEIRRPTGIRYLDGIVSTT